MCIRDRISVLFRGLSFGIDFKGGSEIVLQFDKQIDIAQIRNNITSIGSVSYTHLRAHETVLDLVCRLLLEKKKKQETSLIT